MKFDLLLKELHRSEHDLGSLLMHASDRHTTDHEIHHIARELSTWSRRHLREIYMAAAGVSVDWEMLAQAAQGVKRHDLLAVASRCHADTLRQMKWANAMLKASSTQILVS